MNWKIVKNDFKRNKSINLTLFLFVIFSAYLAILSVLMGVQTFISISELYEKAQPPHFLQMHKGEVNHEKINQFMSNYQGITYWQTVTMINVDGQSLNIVDNKNIYNLSDSRLDISLVKQNESRDLLINYEHEKVILSEGEIGIPVLLKDMYDMKIGNQVILSYNDIQRKFVIKEFVLDSQMNSSMVSSTRILISNQDFDVLKDQVGEKEYLIEAYLKDSKEAANLQTSYENEGLPQNGQAVTYAMIFLLSAITDIIMVFVLLLVSILLIIVSFVCIKFTIMASLEEEIGEIGTMKAIGFTHVNIRNIYLSKYIILAIVGVITGYILALMTNGIFTNHIKKTFGNMDISPLSLILSLIIGFFIFIFITYYCKKILKKIKKITVVDSLVRGKGFDKDKGCVKDGLYKSKKLSINWLLAIREVVHKFKNWIIVSFITLITLLMTMIPFNLMNTFDSPEFITYMGSSLEDILIEVENGKNLESNYNKVIRVLESDNGIENYHEYRRVRVQTIDSENEFMNLNIDSGDNSGDDLKYISGRPPYLENEIALSYFNANELGKDLDETLILFYDGIEKEFIISGIYQDVTSGGYTAKSKYAFSELDSLKYSLSVNLKDNSEVEKKADEWSEIIGSGVTVDPMEEFIDQTLGGVVKQLKTIVLIIFLIGASLVILITILFLKLRLVKDFSEIAILKALGFSEIDIKKQYMIKIGCVSIIGIFSGIILTGILGEKIVNLVLGISGLGIRKIELIVNPLVQYIVGPLLLMTLVLLVSWFVLKKIERYNIISIINE